MSEDLFMPEPAKPKRPRARAPQPEPISEDTAEIGVGALVETVQANPIAVFTDGKQYSDFYARMKAETAKHVPDVTTPKGRDAIRSLAFRVTKSKTTLDKAGLGLTEEARKTIALVNESRKKMVAELDTLAAEVRKPLTDWETAEEARITKCNAVIANLKSAGLIAEDDTSETVRQRGAEVWEIELDPDLFGDMLDTAQDAKTAAVEALGRAFNRLKKAEDDAARLAALEAAEAERQRLADIEAAEREARETAEREAAELAEAEAEEERRAIAAREAELAAIEEGKRIAAMQAAEAERSRLEQEREAERQAEQNAATGRQREHEAALRAERDRFDTIEREHQAEINRLAEIQRQRDADDAAEATRIADEAAAQKVRDEDRAHKLKVLSAIKAAIMEAGGIDEKPAKAIALALANGLVPACKVTW